MAGITSPVIRARNVQYQTGQAKRVPGRRSSTSSSAARRAGKTVTHPYFIAFLLIVLSGGAIFQILKLLGFGELENEDLYD
ncbi:hypothetical protein EDD11_009749 [Mortierella claussenii]|nr:hypothetical protein EDD11_009749 [Mortierella claussenii]